MKKSPFYIILLSLMLHSDIFASEYSDMHFFDGLFSDSDDDDPKLEHISLDENSMWGIKPQDFEYVANEEIFYPQEEDIQESFNKRIRSNSVTSDEDLSHCSKLSKTEEEELLFSDFESEFEED